MSDPNLSSPSERRHWPRLITDFLISGWLKGSSEKKPFLAKDISIGGMMFESPDHIPIDTQLVFDFCSLVDANQQGAQQKSLQARVKWIREITCAIKEKSARRYTVGVSFEEITPEEKNILSDYVEKRIKSKNSPNEE